MLFICLAFILMLMYVFSHMCVFKYCDMETISPDDLNSSGKKLTE